MRSFLSGLCILAAGILSFAAVPALWEQRVLMNEEAFVRLGQDVLEKEPVQEALTDRIDDEVMVVARSQGLDVALLRAVSPQVVGALVAELPESNIGKQALGRTHQLAVGVIRNDEVLETEDGLIVLDLREVVAGVLQTLGATGLVDPRRVPENAGRILLIEERDVGWTLEWIRLFDESARYLVVAPLVALLLALLIAPNRGRALASAGLLLLICALLRIGVLLVPAATEVIDNASVQAEALDAARATYEVFARSYLTYEVILCAACVAAIAVGLVLASRRRAW